MRLVTGILPSYPMRLLFSSIHCYLDPSSGAALCTRELLELLAARGADCRVLTTGILDPARETSLHEVLATLELPTGRFQAELGTGRMVEVIDMRVNGVRVTRMPTASSRAERSPDQRESAMFLKLVEQVFDRFRPEVLLTYGGHPASLELMRRARLRGIAVVFNIHIFGYNDR
jgi:Glycosyl transferase 4-like domain